MHEPSLGLNDENDWNQSGILQEAYQSALVREKPGIVALDSKKRLACSDAMLENQQLLLRCCFYRSSFTAVFENRTRMTLIRRIQTELSVIEYVAVGRAVLALTPANKPKDYSPHNKERSFFVQP
ncbi:hypothetical protein [Methylobacter sp.]|uniref:hypothetical protein n=1 Tax=Methylobacter sp. TaxID=2051955 RepID=UPI00122A98A0|nr:hypothetical protein [Methylobacter sp.]TAK64937.1 MAG: hypothetical protein EPO18_01810 [Methylobacter sp.]